MYFVWLLPGCCLAGQRLPSHPHLTRASLRLRRHYRTFWKVSSCLPSLVGGACPSQPPLAGNPASLAGAALERGRERGDEGGHVWSCQAVVRAGLGCGESRAGLCSGPGPQPCCEPGPATLSPAMWEAPGVPGAALARSEPGRGTAGCSYRPRGKEWRTRCDKPAATRTVQPASNKPQTHTSQGRT